MKKQRHFSIKKYAFFICGFLAVASNFGVMEWLVQGLRWNDFWGRCSANAVAVEISLMFSFFLYLFLVWPHSSKLSFREILFGLMKYHFFALPQALLRIFFLFPLLEHLGAPYQINTLVGVLISVFLNYKRSIIKGNMTHERYRPESLYFDKGPKKPGRKRPFEKIRLFSVVIPVHNEAKSIGDTVRALLHRLSKENINFEILVVNDHSHDRTEQVLRTLCVNPRVRYMNNRYPNGFGFAVRCGLEQFRGDAVAVVMGDLSDSPDDLVGYYRKLLEGYDCVFGSRFMKGSRLTDYPTHKLILNRLANQFIKFLFKLKTNDTTNAFKAYRAEVIQGIMPLISNHFNLTVEMPLKAAVRGYSYAVIPISWQNRKKGISKLKIREMGSRYLFIVLSVYLERVLSKGDYIHQKMEVTTSHD